jgi:putative endonuclease
VSDRRALGASGEEAAAAWYAARGYAVVARNWRCREGELDLVLRRGATYVFCEVKARTSDRYGAPVEAVGRAKQARVRRLAARWLSEAASGAAAEVRFDVAAVSGSGRGDDVSVAVVEAAF